MASLLPIICAKALCPANPLARDSSSALSCPLTLVVAVIGLRPGRERLLLTRTLPIRGPVCRIRLKTSSRSILGSILHALSQADSVPCCAPSQHQRRVADVSRSLATG